MGNKIKRFEDLIAWQKSRTLAADIYRVSAQRPFSRDFALQVQIRRAAVSIASNIAEGFERWGLGEFQHFLSIAKASCAEVRTQLYIAHDVGHIDEAVLRPLLQRAEAVAEIIGRLRSAVARTRRRTQDAGHRTQDQAHVS
jgi:four helix bundle protein